jgi:hypothetical protein
VIQSLRQSEAKAEEPGQFRTGERWCGAGFLTQCSFYNVALHCYCTWIKAISKARQQWLMAIILATWEAELQKTEV